MEQQPNLQNNNKDTLMIIVETILLATLLITFIDVFFGITGVIMPLIITVLSFIFIKSIKQKFKEKKAGKKVVWVEKKSLIGLIFLIIALFFYSIAKQNGLL
jgi:4-hydroxybenzoate polyprenyltransferase